MHDEPTRRTSGDATPPPLRDELSNNSHPEEDTVFPVPGMDRLRMWAPWRMQYVGGHERATCVFCEHAHSEDDAASFVLYRNDLVYVVMNLFPYAGGHLMIVPMEHVDSPENLDDATLVALQRMLPPVLRALRRALRCDGFNVGHNIGAAAGAGIADHLHQHVVPRWVGDANFMPVLSSTQVLPELIPATYGKLRAELERELEGNFGDRRAIAVVLLDQSAKLVAVSQHSDGTIGLPTATPEPDQPVWQAASTIAKDLLANAIFLGWAGQTRAGTPFERAGLALIGTARQPSESPTGTAQENLQFIGWEDARRRLDDADRAALERALALL